MTSSEPPRRIVPPQNIPLLQASVSAPPPGARKEPAKVSRLREYQTAPARSNNAQGILNDYSTRRSLEALQGLSRARKLMRRVSTVPCDPIHSDSTHDDADPILTRLSSSEVGFVITNMIVGNALLTIPYSFVICGWFALPLTIGSVGLMTFTASLLGDVLAKLRQSSIENPDYFNIGERAFGQHFSSISGAFCVGECFFVLVVFFVFTGQSLSRTFGCPIQNVIFMSSVVAIFIKLIPKRYFSVLSSLGIFIVVLACGACIYSGFELQERNTAQSFLGTEGTSGMFVVIGVVAVACSDHSVFPDVYNKAESGEAFICGLYIAFVAFLIVVLLLCGATYATFGSSLDAVALTNIGRGIDGQVNPVVPEWLPQACNIVLAFRCLQVMPAFQSPILRVCYSLLGRCGIDRSISDLETELSLLPSNPSKFLWCFLLNCLVMFSAAGCGVALGDELPVVEALTSSLFKSVNAFIIPCWGYCALCREELEGKPLKRFMVVSILAFGIVWGIVGTASSAISIWKSFIG